MTANVLQDLTAALGVDIQAFLPELTLCFAIVLMLLLKVIPKVYQGHMGWAALIFTLIAFMVSWQQWSGSPESGKFDPRVELGIRGGSIQLFSGLLVYDNFTIFLRMVLTAFTFLVVLLTMMTGVPDDEDSADFYVLLLGSTLGMCIMASANHLLMIFLGVEMASLPSYALAGFLKGRRQSSEAALKYVVYGGGAAGIMLYGISLLAGRFGTGYMPDLFVFINSTPLDAMTLLGILFLLIGIAFKLAAVPFHFWCPDVFEGAPAEVGAFLSVASKAAALAMLARITLGLAGLGAIPDPGAWHNMAPYLVPALALFAVVTTTFGNLAAYFQNNLKRLLAYSTIAHAGFMLMGLACLTREGVGAMLFYIVVYTFMNLGAFAVVAFLRNLTGSEDLRDYRGMVYRNPLLVICLAVFMLSLLGLPPLGGFTAKFQIFVALFDAAQDYISAGQDWLAYILYALILIGGINSVIALFYYVRVLRVMILERTLEQVENRPVETLPTPRIPNTYLVLLSLAVIYYGLFWSRLDGDTGDKGINTFQATPIAGKMPDAAKGGEQ